MTNTTPLGTLIKLPPEIRHQIYDHVLDRNYLVFWTYYPREDFASPSGRLPTIADLAIRCVSKGLNADANARLFSSETVFSFLIRFDFHERLPPGPAKKDTKRMMNVEFVVDPGSSLEAVYIDMAENDMVNHGRSMWGTKGEVKGRKTIYGHAAMNSRCEASVNHFTGVEIERNSLFVKFRGIEDDFHLFMDTGFFQTLKKCIGFRTVRMALEWFGWVDSVRVTVPAVEKVDGVRMELEQCWGPCVVRDVTDQYMKSNGAPGDDDMWLYYAFELVFQPLEFHRKKGKGGGAGVMKEADRLTEGS